VPETSGGRVCSNSSDVRLGGPPELPRIGPRLILGSWCSAAVQPRARSGGSATLDPVNPDALARAEALISTIPDFPEPGILFRDISPLLADAAGLRTIAMAMAEPFVGRFDVVAGVEARGFLLAGALAVASGAGLAPIRKAGKLPRPAGSVSYDLEYGSATIEMSDDLPAGTRVLLVDDVLATGGTLRAGQQLLEQLGYEITGTAVLMELAALGGQRVCGPVHSVFTV